MIDRMVAGFLFNDDQTKVLLILKDHPQWQAGNYNAIGGKVEPNETALEAMRREFKEETGVVLKLWSRFTTLSGEGWSVDFFSTTNSLAMSLATSQSAETIDRFDIMQLPVNRLANLRWLIMMALDIEQDRCSCFNIQEIL